MATLVPLNTFKTIATNVYTSQSLLYTAPLETATIILTAQVSNISKDYANVTFIHRSNVAFGGDRLITDTELVKDYEIPPNDASSVIVGKIVLEQEQAVLISASGNNQCRVLVSLVETSLI
jgi:hypothetical protein